MQNPTGTDMSPHVSVQGAASRRAPRLLRRGGRHLLRPAGEATPRLATLDQLNRVIYARSFSKTLSGSLRVGFVACAQDIANELADIKMLTSITTSQFTERLIYLMLVDGHYRKYLSRLHERLGEARLECRARLRAHRARTLRRAADGMFVWARLPACRGFAGAGRGARSATASCWRPARSSVRISSARRGCGSTSPSATTRACSAGCSARRPARQKHDPEKLQPFGKDHRAQ